MCAWNRYVPPVVILARRQYNYRQTQREYKRTCRARQEESCSGIGLGSDSDSSSSCGLNPFLISFNISWICSMCSSTCVLKSIGVSSPELVPAGFPVTSPTNRSSNFLRSAFPACSLCLAPLLCPAPAPPFRLLPAPALLRPTLARVRRSLIQLQPDLFYPPLTPCPLQPFVEHWPTAPAPV